MLLVQFIDPITGKEYARELSESDLPETLGYGLVGQWTGHPAPLPIISGGSALISHDTTLVEPENATVLLNPFNFLPSIEGYYIIVHQRWDKIYTAAGGYFVQVQINGNAAGEPEEQLVANYGGSYDYCASKAIAMVYCNGSTDDVDISLLHTYGSSRTFGAIGANSSRAQTTIFYAGLNPNHGTLPS